MLIYEESGPFFRKDKLFVKYEEAFSQDNIF